MTDFFQKIISFFMTILAFFGITTSVPVTSEDISRNMAIISQNIENGLLSGELTPFQSTDIDDISELKSLLRDDGNGGYYFSDIDYTRLDVFRPKHHTERLFYISRCMRNTVDETEKAELQEIAVKLVNNWINNKYESTNWWYNEIAEPNLLVESLFMLRDSLNEEQTNSLLKLIEYGVFTKNSDTLSNTGANSADIAMTTIKYGALTGDSRAVTYTVKRLLKDLKISDGEGLKKDYSFFQHGNRLYMGAYGTDFIGGISVAAFMLYGSDYNFSTKQLQNLSDYICKGLKTVCFGNTMDPTVIGRVIARDTEDQTEQLAVYLKRLVEKSNISEKDAITAFIDSIENNMKSDQGLHFFDKSKFLVINNSDFYFSFRGGNKKLYYGETLNDENILAYNTSYPGVTTVMSDGTAFENLSAIRDYSLFPGTTAVYESDSELAEHTDWNKRTLKGKYLDYSTDGMAVCAAKTSHEGNDMTVSCFATDKSAVILGTGMTNTEGKPMITTIEQCRYAGAYQSDGRNITHAGIKYSVLQGGNADVYTENRTGTYQRNNKTANSTSYSGEVFFATMDYSGSFAYSVMAERTDDSYTIIENNEKIQAVRLPNGKIAAVFFKPGSFSFEGKRYTSLFARAVIF